MAEWHTFLFEGRNYRVREDHAGETKGRVGFYTWRFVKAERRSDAEQIARAEVEQAASERLEKTDRSQIDVTYEGMRDTPDVAEFTSSLRGTGFVLYPERAFVAELMYAFEGLSRRWAGRESERDSGSVAA